jgi:hypothetical protein
MPARAVIATAIGLYLPGDSRSGFHLRLAAAIITFYPITPN